MRMLDVPKPMRFVLTYQVSTVLLLFNIFDELCVYVNLFII